MAYAINMIQRASDGFLYTGGGFIEVTDQRNYASVAMFGGNPDDVANLVSGLPNGEYRVIPYWTPGQEGRDFPDVNGTLFSNFTAGAAANSIDITIDNKALATGNFSEIYNAWQSNGGPTILLFFTEAQANSMDGLNYWDGSLGLREYEGYFFCELYLETTSFGGTSAFAQSTFSGTVLWALFM
jgi:hypothetical protein